MRESIIKKLSATGRENITDLIDWLDSTDFFTAPASAKHHLNVEGGLAYHSWSVYQTLRQLDRITNLHLSEETMIITALLHDVCKINRYHKKDDGWEHHEQLPLGHGEKSVILIQRYIKLTDQESMMIRWHMGGYDDSFRRYSNDIQKIYPESLMLYFADHMSSAFFEEDFDTQ